MASQAGHDLFEWWSEMIEVPVVAEGALTADLVASFGPVTDFFGIGEEIWRHDDPLPPCAACWHRWADPSRSSAVTGVLAGFLLCANIPAGGTCRQH